MGKWAGSGRRRSHVLIPAHITGLITLCVSALQLEHEKNLEVDFEYVTAEDMAFGGN